MMKIVKNGSFNEIDLNELILDEIFYSDISENRNNEAHEC